MHRSLRMPLAVAVLGAVSIAPSFAQSQNAFDHANSNASFNRAAPGPLAGAGLPFLIVAGAIGTYKMIRRRGESRDLHGSVRRD